LIPYAIAMVMLVYLVCLALENVRSALLNSTFSGLSQNVERRLKKSADRI